MKKKTKFTFEEWKMRAQIHADRIEVVGGDNLWHEHDPYDLMDEALSAFEKKEDPAHFIERIFQEDITMRAHDDLMAAEAMEYEE